MSSQNSLPMLRRGATLVELLIVVGIAAVLAGLMTAVFFSIANDFTEGLLAQVKEAEALVGKKARPVKPPTKEDLELIPNQFAVIFHASVNDPQAEANRLAQIYNLTIRHVYTSTIRGMAVNGSPQSLADLRREASVKYVAQDRKASICAQTIPTGIRRIGADRSTSLAGDGQMRIIGMVPVVLPPGSTGNRRNVQRRTPSGGSYLYGTDVNIAIIDTGVDAGHPDLYVVYSQGFGFPDATDGHGHGTHCAGIAAARDNNLGTVGVVPGAKIWALKVLGADGKGSLMDAAAALDFVGQHSSQIQVASLSLGGGYFPPLNDAIEACVARGVPCIVAAGNSNDDAAYYSPASAPSAITVAALADSDGKPGAKGGKTSAGNDDTFATFSNYGDIVDVIAPGVDILSTWPNNSYNTISGTSMATPYVAGLVALMRDPDARLSRNIRNVRSGRNNPQFTPAQIRQMLLQYSTESIPGLYDARTYPLINALPF